jgi:MoaA/NifB/PqqE/SkfB family radical SAM enzyme
MSAVLDRYGAPVMLTWQLTRDCNLACLHCCTDSAPGKALPGELDWAQALRLADQIIELQIPYVMLVGGEPTLAPWFWAAAERLGGAETFLKIETNGQSLTEADARRLAKLPVRSVQISIDGATPGTYAKMRPGGTLERALRACELVVKAGLPLEITFAPARFSIQEGEAVIDLAARLGAFRFNTGKLMRVGTAARLWDRLAPSSREYEDFYSMLLRKEAEHAGKMELCFRPFSMAEEAEARTASPSGTLLVLPDGRVKVSAALPFVCADLKTMTLAQAWRRYKAAWAHPKVAEALASAAGDEAALARANEWTDLEVDAEFAGRGQAGSKE